jgi:hypothetical protein
MLRLDVINLFDSIHEIRNGSGIDVFAPNSEHTALLSRICTESPAHNPLRNRQPLGEIGAHAHGAAFDPSRSFRVGAHFLGNLSLWCRLHLEERGRIEGSER